MTEIHEHTRTEVTSDGDRDYEEKVKESVVAPAVVEEKPKKLKWWEKLLEKPMSKVNLKFNLNGVELMCISLRHCPVPLFCGVTLSSSLELRLTIASRSRKWRSCDAINTSRRSSAFSRRRGRRATFASKPPSRAT